MQVELHKPEPTSQEDNRPKVISNDSRQIESSQTLTEAESCLTAGQGKLLEEYRLGQEYVLALHEQVWQIGAILITASLGTFAIVAVQQTISISTLVISIIAGAISTSLLVVWYLIMQRFSSFGRVSYYRMQEIEAELDLWRSRYINYLDGQPLTHMENLSEKDKERLENLRLAFRGSYFKIRARTLEILLIIMSPIVWLSWIAYLLIVLF